MSRCLTSDSKLFPLLSFPCSLSVPIPIAPFRSPALAAMWARHDALVARPDKKLPIEAVAFVTSLACADLNSLSANPVGATRDEIAASAAQSRQAAVTGNVSVTGTSASGTASAAAAENGDDADDAAKIIRQRSRRASLSFGLQSPEQMRQDALGAGQAQVFSGVGSHA